MSRFFAFFERLIDPYAPYAEPDAPPRRLWPFLRQYMGPFRGVFVAAGIASVVVAAIEVGLIWYLGRLVDVLGTAGRGDFWGEHGLELMLAAAFILILRPLIETIAVAFLNNAIMPNFGTIIRWRAHRHVMRQPVGWFENDFAGRIANRIMQTPPAAGEAVFQVFDAISFALAYVILAGLLLSQSDPRLVIPLVIWIGLYAWLVRWTTRRVTPASKAAADARSEVTGRVVDSYTNIHAVKLFAHHDREIAFAGEAIETARQKFAREMRIYTLMSLGLEALNGFLIVAVVGWAVLLWAQEAASLGVVAAATALTLRLNAMTGWIMWAVSSLFRNLGVVAEGMETIAQPVHLLDAPAAPPLALRAGRIEIAGLTHHYGQERGGLAGVTLSVAPGEKIGVVGRSGAGKSTLVKLILRLHDAEAGTIRIDGQDIRTVTQASLRRAIGVVQQDSALLHRSVRDNILYGRPDATEDEMMAAARRAEADDFIAGLRDSQGNTGYDARVGERGVKLSGGQRQRIALARVILKDAPILVLDEATSALDSEVEATIQDTLYGVMQGKTVIAIAHRLSTIARMDRIVVVDDGRIVEAGRHADLMAQGGLYARFWARQSGGFINTDDTGEAAE